MESNSVAWFVLKCPDSNAALDYGCVPVLLALSYFYTAVKHIHVRLSRASLAVGGYLCRYRRSPSTPGSPLSLGWSAIVSFTSVALGVFSDSLSLRSVLIHFQHQLLGQSFLGCYLGHQLFLEHLGTWFLKIQI